VLLSNVRIIEQVDKIGLDIRSAGGVRTTSVQQYARAGSLQETPAIQIGQMDGHDL
jgi:hypothetical protein